MTDTAPQTLVVLFAKDAAKLCAARGFRLTANVALACYGMAACRRLHSG